MRTARQILLAGCVIGVGCAGEGLESGWMRTDSAGVVVVEHTMSPPDVPWWEADLDRATRLETPPGMGELFRVTGALRLASGGTVVADGGNWRLAVFGPDGDFVRVEGRQGEGPGEYRRLNLLARWRADSLAVWDSGARRMNILSGDVEHIRSFPLAVTDDVPYGDVRGVYGDGSLLATGFVALESEITTGRHEFSSPLYHFDADGRPRGSLGLFSVGESYYVARGRGFSVWDAIFPKSVVRLVAGDRLVTASSERYELELRTPGGEVTMLLKRAGTPAQVTERMRAAEEQAMLMSMSDDAAERARPILRDMEAPETLPAFGGVFADRLGTLWVQEFEPGRPASREWRVYDADGALVGRLRLPGGLTPMDAGSDYLVGVLTDELGIEQVVEAPLIRSRAPRGR